MTLSLDPYLAAIRAHIAAAYPGSTGQLRVDGLFSHRVLTQLLIKSQLLPALHKEALGEFSTLLDELMAELMPLNEGLMISGRLQQHIRAVPDYREAEAALQSAARLLLSNPNDKRRALLRKLTEITFNVQQVVHQAALDQEIKPVVEAQVAEPLDASRKKSLLTWLRDKFAEPALELGNIKALIGGGSKQTLMVELKQAGALPPTIVLRIDKAAGLTGTPVADEYHIIEAVFEAGMPGPRPYAVELDASILGAAFIVVSHLPGRNIGDAFHVFEPSRQVAVDIAHAMGKLHQIPPERVGDRVIGAKTSAAEYVRENMDGFESNWRAFAYPSIALEQAYAWLKEHLDFANGKRAILHRDIGAHNLLVHEDRLTAILDWETVVIGNPAQDLAYAHNMITQMMPWEEFLVEYQRAGGELPSAAEFDFYRLWSATWRMHYMMLTRSIFESGIRSDLLMGYSAQQIMQRGEYDLHWMVKHVNEHY